MEILKLMQSDILRPESAKPFEPMIFNFSTHNSKISSLVPSAMVKTEPKKSFAESMETSHMNMTNQLLSHRVSGSSSHKSTSRPFVLRNVNPHEIWRKYKAGYYVDMTIDTSPPITKVTGFTSSMPDTNDRCRERFYETGGGVTSTLVTVGQEDFENAIAHRDRPMNINMLKSGLCKWCRCDLAERLASDAYPIGIVTGVKKKSDVYIFTVLSNTKTCTGSCCISLAKSKREYWQYIPIIKFMFNLIAPSQELYDAPDWELHERNGGPLADDSYYLTSMAYVPNGNTVILPTKTEYLVTNF